MSDLSPDGLPPPPEKQQQEPEALTSTFSKIVATCLHDLQDFSDVWYPLAKSESEETPYTLAGMSLKTLLNDAMKDEKIMNQVWKIVAENEPIPSSKAPYLVDHPELSKDLWKVKIQVPVQGVIGIEIIKSKGRLVVKKEGVKIPIILTEFGVGEDFEVPLYYANYATDLLLPDFRISVLEDDRKTRENVLAKVLEFFSHTSSYRRRGTRKCYIRCYMESKFHFIDDKRGSNAYYKLKECTDAEHDRYHLKEEYPFYERNMSMQERQERDVRLGRNEGIPELEQIQNIKERNLLNLRIDEDRLRNLRRNRPNPDPEVEESLQRREQEIEDDMYASQLQMVQDINEIYRRLDQQAILKEMREQADGRAPDDVQEGVEALDQNGGRRGIEGIPDDGQDVVEAMDQDRRHHQGIHRAPDDVEQEARPLLVDEHIREQYPDDLEDVDWIQWIE